MSRAEASGTVTARRFCRLVGLAGLLAFVLFAFTPLVGSLHLDPPAEAGRVDAIVVLGAGMGTDGLLSGNSLRRLVDGVRLHRQGRAPLLVLLGPPWESAQSEADVRAALAAELGVPPAAILRESAGRTTREEAERAAALLLPRGARRILLVTGGTHLARARRLFERAGFGVLAAPVQEVSGRALRPEARLGAARILLQELIARAYYRIAGWL